MKKAVEKERIKDIKPQKLFTIAFAVKQPQQIIKNAY